MIIDRKQVPGRATILAYIVLFLAFALLATAKEAGLLEASAAKRYIGIVLALMLAVTGNFLPKLLHPERRNAEALRRQRRTGWGIVTTGLLLILALLVAPADQIELWSGVAGLGGLSLVFVDAASYHMGKGSRAPTDPDQDALERKHAAVRLSALLIVHAIAWAFAMFLADYVWGDASAMWMVIAFTIANGLLAVARAPAFAARART